MFTRKNRLRLRYVAGCFSVSLVAMVGLMGSSPSSVAFVPRGYDAAGVGESAVLASVSVSNESVRDESAPVGLSIDEKLGPLLVQEEEFADFPEHDVSFVPEDDLDRILKIGAGDTIAGILQQAGLNGAEVFRAVKAMSRHYNPRSVKPGQILSVSMEYGEGGKVLKTLSMKLDSIREIVVSRDLHDRFEAEIHEKEVVMRHRAAQASIQTSLYGSAARAGIPASVVAEMIRIYSYEVDFQRDLRQGDTFEILYETYETEDGDFARYGNVLYANLMVRGQEIPVYRFKKSDGTVDYFHKDGVNLKRTLMQTPIDGARMSSGFGMRKHPVLGYNKMHKGVDFAAPQGTPIYAAGDGVIDKIGRNGGYGNYIRIRHNGSLKTAYAHMRRFAKGMKRGTRVKQGQVIGYVGTTGRSTGPHLHFEVLSNGQQINPKKVKTAAREKLAGGEMKSFQGQVDSLRAQYASYIEHMKVARTDISE